MKTKHIKIIIGSAVALTALLITVGNGCSKRAELTNMSSTSNSAANVFDPDGQNTSSSVSNDIIPGAKTASVVYAKQALDQLTSCAGVRKPSDDTIRMYNSKEGSISAVGDFNSVTAPMLVAVTNISGEICDDLIDQEVADQAGGRSPRIFQGFNMTSTALPSQADVDQAIARLAQSCWQKQESVAERDQIRDMLTSIPAGSTLAQRRQALLLCTAVLSSLKSLTN